MVKNYGIKVKNYGINILFFSSIYPTLTWALKENAVNEETCAVSFQNMSHNIHSVRIGKWRQLNKIYVHLNIPK